MYAAAYDGAALKKAHERTSGRPTADTMRPSFVDGELNGFAFDGSDLWLSISRPAAAACAAPGSLIARHGGGAGAVT